MHVLFVALLLAAGCGDDDAAPDSGESDGGLVDELTIAAPTAPADPRPPRTQCATGWFETETALGTRACVPFEELPACAENEHVMLGEAPGCRRIGQICPVGRFADDVPEDALFVDPDYVGESDGTRAQPFRAMEDALATSRERYVLALSKGRHVAPVTNADMTILGACVEETTVERPGEHITVQTRPGQSIEARDLTIAATFGGAAALGGRVVLRGVVIRGAGQVAAGADDAEIELEDVVLRGLRSETDGAGFICDRGARCVFDRVTIEGIEGVPAILADRGSVLEGRDVLVHDVESEGYSALIVAHEAEATLDRTFMIDLSAYGVVSIAGSTATLRSFAVRESGGLAGLVLNGGRLTLDRALIDRASGLAVAVIAGALTLGDVVVADTQQIDDLTLYADGGGNGIFATGDCVLQLNRVVVERGFNIGISASDGPRIAGQDVLVRRVASGADRVGGAGIVVQAGSSELHRVRIEECEGEGLGIVAGSANLEDVTVWRTEARVRDGDLGVGIEITDGAAVALRRANVDASRTAGIMIEAASELTAEDLVVQGTRGRAADGYFGRGVQIGGGSAVSLTRVLLEDNREYGVVVADEGTSVVGRDVIVAHTSERECASSTCADLPFGVGIGAYGNPTVDLVRFELRESALCGLYLAYGAEAVLEDGRIGESSIGVCAEAPVESVLELLGDVRFEDNDANLESRTLPVPDAVVP